MYEESDPQLDARRLRDTRRKCLTPRCDAPPKRALPRWVWPTIRALVLIIAVGLVAAAIIWTLEGTG